MGENYEQMMVRLALDGAGFMDGLRATAAAEKKWGEQLTASLAAENKKRNELSIAAALERNQKINAIEEAARQQRIAKVIEEKEIVDGQVAEEASLRLAADKAIAAGMVSDYKKYSAARESISAQIVAAEEAKDEAIAAADKATIKSSWMRYQAFLNDKLRADAAFIEKERAMREIAGGSGGFGWGGAGGFSAAEGGAGAAAAKAYEGSLTVMSREAMVMVREGLRRNWSRMLGSLTIFLSAMGGQVQKFIQGLFGFTGLVLGAALTGAYLLYEDIKKFNKELDAIQKENAESIGNTAKAIKEAKDEGIKGAAEFEAHIRSLADAHETLAHWVTQVVKAINEQAAAQEKLVSARGNTEISAINLAAHMGMITPDQAAAARVRSEVGTFSKNESIKNQAIIDEGNALRVTRDEAQRRTKILEAAGRAAEAEVHNPERVKRMKERESIQKTMEAQQARVDSKGGGSDIGNWATNALDPLSNATKWNPLNWFTNPKGQNVTAGDLTQSDRELIEKEKALLKKREAQNEKDIAAQAAAEEAYKQAVKAIDENAQSLKSVNEQLEAFGTKYEDAKTAMEVLHQQLIAKQNANTSAEMTLYESADAVVPTIEMMAGRGYTGRLNKLYGKGGRYDLESGDGIYANAAQGYELAQKQEMWDILHGNGGYEDDGAGGKRLTGQAELDRLNAVAYHDQLKAAGLETPAMQMKDLIDNGLAIVGELKALAGIANNPDWTKQ